MMLACINLQFWQSLGKQVSMAFNLHLEINNCFSLPKKLHFVFKAIHKRNIEHLTSIISKNQHWLAFSLDCKIIFSLFGRHHQLFGINKTLEDLMPRNLHQHLKHYVTFLNLIRVLILRFHFANLGFTGACCVSFPLTWQTPHCSGLLLTLGTWRVDEGTQRPILSPHPSSLFH